MTIQQRTIEEIIGLSRLLGEFGQIKRVTLLPNGDQESDSHHSFSLALIAFELAIQFAPELDTKKILLYSLVHDLPELVTGDTNTLLASSEQLTQKAKHDQDAIEEVRLTLRHATHILDALEAYELKQDDESLFVYWIDKMTTIPTHFYDNGANLQALGIHHRGDIEAWYQRTLEKLQKHNPPHLSAVQVLELAYEKMHDELLNDAPNNP